MKPLNQLLRSNIKNLKPYSSARDEYTGEAAVFLDANENPYNQPYNRYPDPYQRKVKEKIAALKGIDAAQIFLGNGSDEPIDLLFRAFCEPGVDNVVSIDPTYGMYQVAADINNVEVRKVLLTEDFELNTDGLLAACDEHTKLLFICSPNNPTGNCLAEADIQRLVSEFEGIVVLDEAYIDFAPEKSWLSKLGANPNLVILQTFSKAWGMAGIRLGMAFAAPELIKVLSNIKYPYNINILTQEKALELLERADEKQKWVELLLKERTYLKEVLLQLNYVQKVYPSDANYLLVRVDDARGVYDYLVQKQIIIRDRSSVALCAGCLRITVGTTEENKQLTEALNMYPK
ncbi:histidinol-phosphate transaminase [Carboxylicivirga sediminis]|uniref:Histidinol-phosphate aminotransferase n=1 Tax=Carboxylicivirga sediminis TaxID=2006564 RepID=A0A941F4W3_9BACT|nr:histidinol-phosphate transaminase [Carboxylicivirga sediminis]MBR8536469.1 histidinol-phosphate transaminase [Carboxylicivirga sediminis]